MSGQLLTLNFKNPLVDIIYGMLSMSKGVYSYGVESACLMDISEEISEMLNIPISEVLSPSDKKSEMIIDQVRDDINHSAHACAVIIANSLEKRIKGKYIENKEEIEECLNKLSASSLKNLYHGLVECLELHNQKEASDYVGIAILEYIQGDSDKKDDILSALEDK